MKRASVLLALCVAAISAQAQAQVVEPTPPDPMDNAEAKSLVHQALSEDFGAVYDNNESEKVRCKRRNEFRFDCGIFFVGAFYKGFDGYVGTVDVRNVEDDFFEWQYTIRQYSGICIVRTGGLAGCKERTHRERF